MTETGKLCAKKESLLMPMVFFLQKEMAFGAAYRECIIHDHRGGSRKIPLNPPSPNDEAKSKKNLLKLLSGKINAGFFLSRFSLDNWSDFEGPVTRPINPGLFIEPPSEARRACQPESFVRRWPHESRRVRKKAGGGLIFSWLASSVWGLLFVLPPL